MGKTVDAEQVEIQSTREVIDKAGQDIFEKAMAESESRPVPNAGRVKKADAVVAGTSSSAPTPAVVSSNMQITAKPMAMTSMPSFSCKQETQMSKARSPTAILASILPSKEQENYNQEMQQTALIGVGDIANVSSECVDRLCRTIWISRTSCKQ